ncbi:hypothetical protein FRC07_012915 [Ceratobasidium sp. 392]|nr:hypothetical protein FRC07_012915 [Ceratobasidium sp. 392]
MFDTTEYDANFFPGFDEFMNPPTLFAGAISPHVVGTTNLFWAEPPNCFPYSPILNDAPYQPAPITCNPAEIMAPSVGSSFDEFLQDESPESQSFEDFDPTFLVAGSSQLPTPPLSWLSSPQQTTRPSSPDGTNTGLFTPPSEQPMCRTRRINASASIYDPSLLNFNTADLAEHTVDPAFLASSSAYTQSVPNISTVSDLYRIDQSPASDADSSSFRGSPPPARRASRSTGVQRVTVSDLRKGNKKSQPVPTGDPDRPHGCRHPGRNPGDLPCSLDFARKHDWSRHQRVHTGETPYSCRGCKRPFKRPDARGRHWDARPECERIHTNIVRELLATGEMATDDRDIPVLRRRAQKAECRNESERTGVPMSELKATMKHVKTNNAFGF